MKNEPNGRSDTINAQQTSFFQNEAFQFFTRIVITSTTVTTVLFPLELTRTLLQTNTDKAKEGYRSRNPFSMVSPLLFNFGRVHSLVNGYVNSNKSSLIRNTMLSNKESVADNVDAVTEFKALWQEWLRQGFSLMATAAIIASFDTLLTQYHTNLGVLNAQGVVPVLNTQQKFSFAFKGITARGTKTFTTTLGCIASGTLISDMVDQYLISRNSHPYAHALGSGSLCGFLIAPVSNVFDVLYKNTLKMINLTTGEMPRYRLVAHTLWRNHGPRIFLQGSLVGGLYNTVAFVTFNGITWFLDNRIFINENRHVFFNTGTIKSPPDTPEATPDVKKL